MIPAMLASADVHLVAVASRDAAKAESFAVRHGAVACTYDELLSRDDVEAVYVPLPVGLHHTWGMRVLEAGKHLLLEKTFTERSGQALDLVSRASARGLVAMEALMYRFHPVHTALRALVGGGAIGEIRHIDAQFGFPLLPPNDIRRQRELGGGASLDSLVYPLSLCIELVGIAPERADVNFVRDEHGVDLRGAVQIGWRSISAQCTYGMGYFYRNGCQIWGSDGSVSLERAFTRPPDMPAELTVRTADGNRTTSVPPADHFSLMLAHFAARIRGETAASPAEGEDLLTRMGWVEQIRASGGLLQSEHG